MLLQPPIGHVRLPLRIQFRVPADWRAVRLGLGNPKEWLPRLSGAPERVWHLATAFK